MKTTTPAALLCALAATVYAGGALAGPAVGVGLSWTFGGPAAQSGAAVGLKVFSTDREDRAAASLGVDYSFAERGFRPNVGVAYLSRHNAYVDASVGYSMQQQRMNFGLGAGYVNTQRR